MRKTLFYKNVTVLDFAYYSAESKIVGDAFRVDVFLSGEKNDEEMILDFSLVKKQIKKIIDDICDHRLAIPKKLTRAEGSFITVEEKEFYYKAPDEAFYLLDADTYSPEALARQLEKTILEQVPKNIDKVELSFESETEKQSYFHYTHGLRDHGGNCQRLFHGHRNTVRVFLDQKREEALESWLSESEFQSNVHFCYWDNVQNKNDFGDVLNRDLQIGRTDSKSLVHIAYESNQGHFEGKLSPEEVYFMPTETTIENLSYNFAQIIKRKKDISSEIEVWGFEGIGKGAKSTLT